MKYIYIKLCLAASVMLFSACDKDLELVPISSLSVSSFFQTEDDAKSAVNGMYGNLRSLSGSLYLYGDERSENTEQTDLGTGNDVNRNTLQPTTGGSDWGSFYTLINDINLILTKVPNIEFTDNTEKDELLAQAYFMRAWTYFMIARIWGDAPLLLVPVESTEQKELTPTQRDPASALFTQIKSDIDTAISLFAGDDVGTRYKASKPAANTLKADVYLWTAKQAGGGNTDLNTALAAINQVVGHADLDLMGDYYDVFRSTEATTEDIFTVYRDLVETGGGFFAGRYNLSDSFWASLSDDDKDVIPFVRGSVRFYTTTQVFRDQIIANAAGNTDPREMMYFLEYTNPGGGETRHIMNKYQGEEVSGGQHEFSDDYKIYRYADAILMRAEIQNALNNPGDAVTDLNLIRNRVSIGDYAGGMGQQEVDDAILLERSVEFAFEGKRWWDLVRFGMAYELVPNLVGREDDQPILWPISTVTITLNPNLKQTPGY